MTSLKVYTLIIALGVVPQVWAHNGEDHSAPAANTGTFATLPRAVAKGDVLELVAVADPRGLTLYLNDLNTNTPLKQAQVDLEVDSHPAPLTPATEGVYQSTLKLASGKHVLVITATSATTSDLLETTLTIPDPAAKPKTRPATQWGLLLGSILGVAAFLWGGLIVLRSRS